MLHYILQIIAFQVVFLLVYDLFLKRETFFNYNRFYLLATAIISFFLPFIKLESIQSVSKDFVVVLPEVIIGARNVPTELDTKVAQLSGMIIEEQTIPLWQIVMFVGVITTALFFVIKLIKLYLLKHKNPKRWNGDVLLVELLDSNSAFSFFNTIFLGEKLSKEQSPSIFRHELVHVKQLHSLDLISFEIMRIVMWFNPLIYMYQNRIKALHEFIADETAIKQTGKQVYYQDLLNQIFETQHISFINTFFKKSLIKKRIVMLQKSKSKQVSLLKYALLIPTIFTMLFYVSCVKESGIVEIDGSEINLEQFSYQLSSENGIVAPDVMKMKNAYQAFLVSNKDYVGWGKINEAEETTDYSIHHKDEEVPENYSKGTITTASGESFTIYYSENPFGSKNDSQELDSSNYSEEKEVAFSTIENVPTFSECDDLATNEEKKSCTSMKIAKFVNKNFNTDLATQFGLEGRQRIAVYFKINKEGDVISIGARAQHPALEQEAKRVISKLPKFIPGTDEGKPVVVPYSLPIIFQINTSNDNLGQNTYQIKERKVLNFDDVVGEGVAFSVVDKIPTFNECQSLGKDLQRKCVEGRITNFVNKNFNTDLATQFGLEGKQRISVFFKINKEGDVISIGARAQHPVLEEEAKRVISKLPKFIPGTDKGKPVVVLYSLPIVFQIHE